MKGFHHTKRMRPGDRVTVRLSDGYVGRATVVEHVRYYSPSGDVCGHVKVRYDDKIRRLRTVDDQLCEPLDALDLLAELGELG